MIKCQFQILTTSNPIMKIMEFLSRNNDEVSLHAAFELTNKLLMEPHHHTGHSRPRAEGARLIISRKMLVTLIQSKSVAKTRNQLKV
jgi:hypothetical protein